MWRALHKNYIRKKNFENDINRMTNPSILVHELCKVRKPIIRIKEWHELDKKYMMTNRGDRYKCEYLQTHSWMQELKLGINKWRTESFYNTEQLFEILKNCVWVFLGIQMYGWLNVNSKLARACYVLQHHSKYGKNETNV